MYIVYKTTNILTKQFYIGCHKCNTLDDGYLGSGAALKESLNLYGIENHKREVLAMYDNAEEALNYEHALVNAARFSDKDLLLNKTNGGRNFDHINNSGKNVYVRTTETLKIQCEQLARGRITQRNRFLNDAEYFDNYKKHISEKVKNHQKINGNPFKGKHHTEQTKQIISQKVSISSKGKNNSQFGTYWITNGIESLKWSENKGPIPEGYYKGRTIRKH